MMPQADPTVYERLSHVETDVAAIKGTQEITNEKLVEQSAKLDQLITTVSASSNSAVNSSVYQKGLLGAIIVQMLLTGMATPDHLKILITQVLGGVTH